MNYGFKKIVWAEGVLLSQQHFQQWEAAWEHDKKTRHLLLAPDVWGFGELEVEEGELVNNRFLVKRFQAIFPDGFLIDYQDNAAVLSYELPENQKLSIYLGVPINEQVSGITGYHDVKLQAAWLAEYLTVADYYDSSRVHEVLCAKLNVQLLSSLDNLAQYKVLKIAEVIKNETNQFVLDNTFIPSVMHVNSSPLLMNWITKISNEILAKWQALTCRYTDNVDSINLLILTILSETIGYLSDARQRRETSPCEVFARLRQFAAKLAPLARIDPISIPHYKHDDLRLCFTSLGENISELLSMVMPAGLAKVNLLRRSDTLYYAENIDINLLQKADFFLAVHNPSQDAKWIDQLVRQVKISCLSGIDRLIASAMLGVNVSHQQNLPAKIAIKPGCEYFYLEPNGLFWIGVREERSLAVFLPTVFKDAKVELVVVSKS